MVLEIVNITDRMPAKPAYWPNGRMVVRRLASIRQIVIHHTVTPDMFDPAGIARYHVYSRQYPVVGYTYMIQTDGTIYQVNALSTVSWHVAGANTRSIGVALIGTFTLSPPGASQLEAAGRLIRHLHDLLGRPVPVVGHKEVPGNATACPGDTWLTWRKYLLPDGAT